MVLLVLGQFNLAPNKLNKKNQCHYLAIILRVTNFLEWLWHLVVGFQYRFGVAIQFYFIFITRKLVSIQNILGKSCILLWQITTREHCINCTRLIMYDDLDLKVLVRRFKFGSYDISLFLLHQNHIKYYISFFLCLK